MRRTLQLTGIIEPHMSYKEEMIVCRQRRREREKETFKNKLPSLHMWKETVHLINHVRLFSASGASFTTYNFVRSRSHSVRSSHKRMLKSESSCMLRSTEDVLTQVYVFCIYKSPRGENPLPQYIAFAPPSTETPPPMLNHNRKTCV